MLIYVLMETEQFIQQIRTGRKKAHCAETQQLPPPYPLNITDTYHNKTESIAKWNRLFHTYLSASVTCRRAALFPPHRHTHSSSAWLTGPDVLYTATVCTHSCFFATAHCPRARNTADVIQTSPPPPLSRAAFSHCPTLVCKVGRCLLTRK